MNYPFDALTTTEPINADQSLVKDDGGNLLYTIIGPNYFDRDTETYIRCNNTVSPADVEDNCLYKTSETKFKVGYSDRNWLIGILTRDDIQYLLKPHALTAFDDPKDIDRIFTGIVESAKIPTFSNDITIQWSGLFSYVQISAIPTEGGFNLLHRFYSDIRKTRLTKFYGTIWEINNPRVVDVLQSDSAMACEFIVCNYKGTDYLIEYFPETNFHYWTVDGVQDEVTDYIEHNYSTVGGALGADTTWTAGTYYLTSIITTGAYDLTFDAASGSIYVKTSGNFGININGASTVKTINTSSTNKVYFTSKNDDTIGETISGSTGTPLSSDHTLYYICKTSYSGLVEYTLRNCEFRYMSGVYPALAFWNSTNDWTTDIVWENLVFKNINVVNGSFVSCVAGCYQYATHPGKSLYISGISIDDTNWSNGLSRSSICLRPCYSGATATTYLEDAYIKQSYNNPSGIGIVFGTHLSYNHNYVAKNIYCSGYFYPDISGAAIFVPNTSATNNTIKLYNCIVSNPSGYGILFYRTAGTQSASIYNSVVHDSISGIFESGTVTSLLSNCGIYNCSAYTNLDTISGLISGVDPQISNLPTGTVIHSDFILPNGLAVTNYSGYEFLGSGTFTQNGIDVTDRTPTGYKYSSDKVVTPGINYRLSTFPEAFYSFTPASGSAAGGTSVTASGRALGTSGTLALDGTNQTINTWADGSINFTTLAHGIGTVSGVITTYRGGTISAPNAYTFYASESTSSASSASSASSISSVASSKSSPSSISSNSSESSSKSSASSASSLSSGSSPSSASSKSSVSSASTASVSSQSSPSSASTQSASSGSSQSSESSSISSKSSVSSVSSASTASASSLSSASSKSSESTQSASSGSSQSSASSRSSQSSISSASTQSASSVSSLSSQSSASSTSTQSASSTSSQSDISSASTASASSGSSESSSSESSESSSSESSESSSSESSESSGLPSVVPQEVIYKQTDKVFNIENLAGQQIPQEIVDQLKVLGRVTFPLKPTTVSAVSTSAEQPSQDQLDGTAKLNGVLDHVGEMEDLVEQLEDMLDQLTKNMSIPVVPGSAIEAAVKALGGDGSEITQDIFNRAQAIIDHAPILTLGRDPFLDAATGDGKLTGPYTNCDEITKEVSKLWNTSISSKSNPETPLKDATKKISEDFEKSKNNMIIEILLMLWWNMLWPKFIVSLVIIKPLRFVIAFPFDSLVCFFKDMSKTCNKGFFKSKPKSCLEQYGPLNKMLNRLACLLICKIPKPLYKRYKPMVEASSIKILKGGKLVPCNCSQLEDCPQKNSTEPKFDRDGKLDQLSNVVENLLGGPNEPCVDTSAFTSGIPTDEIEGPGMPPNCLDSARIVLDAVISDALTPSDPSKTGITGAATISSILEEQTMQVPEEPISQGINPAGTIPDITSLPANRGDGTDISGIAKRFVSFAPWPNRIGSIGSAVKDTSSILVHNLSKGEDYHITYQSDLTNAVDRYCIVDSNGVPCPTGSYIYNCDLYNALSNTQGLMYMSIEEI